MNKLIELTYDQCNLTLTINLLVLIIFFAVLAAIYFLQRFIRHKKIHTEIVPVELKYSVGGAEIKYNIVRNYKNVEIAHKIYIELITRKAAIEIEEDKDVIVEVYNSWYTLFQITRDELKLLSGNLLTENKTSEELIKLLTDILNKGLRPHLTKYQAKLRKWYDEEIQKTENSGKSPQEIQRQFADYNELIASIKDVNLLLIDYAKQLKLIITGA